jgi:hypothetical protein
MLAALAVFAAAQVHAAPFAVQVGEARIGLDAPSGFADTQFTGSPRLQELGESLTSASNRILLFALSDADLRRFMVGDPLELQRYMIAVTPRGMERERVGEAAFKQYTGEAMRGLGTPPAEKDLLKYLDTRQTGAVSLLQELRNEPDVLSVLQGVRAKGSGFFERSKYQLSSTTLMLVRGKALSLSLYTQYDDPADLEWIRLTTARWIDELKRLNSR